MYCCVFKVKQVSEKEKQELINSNRPPAAPSSNLPNTSAVSTTQHEIEYPNDSRDNHTVIPPEKNTGFIGEQATEKENTIPINSNKTPAASSSNPSSTRSSRLSKKQREIEELCDSIDNPTTIPYPSYRIGWRTRSYNLA